MVNEIGLREAEAFLHERIPITRAMGVRVVTHHDSAFALEAPVAQNSNHLGTAFGGSVNAIATLAAYGLLWLDLRGDKGAYVVVAESSIRFLRPVHEIIRATCIRPKDSKLAEFKSAIATKGKARIKLKVVVEEAGAVAAQFLGDFVALKS
jgi:thioesterase domain-containing protein